jgi:hypothetical protein
LSENLRISAEGTLPKRIGQDNDTCSLILGLLLVKATTKEGWNSKHIKDLGRDGDAFERLRVISLRESATRPGVGRHPRKTLALIAQIGVVGKRVDPAPFAVIHVTRPSHHNLLRILEGQRSKQDRINHAENCAVGPDPQRESQDRNNCEHWRLDQHPQGVFEIG